MRRALLLATLAACDGGTEPTRVVIEQASQMCLYAADPQTASISALRLFEADMPVYLRVGFDTCLSSSCDRDRVASCTVTPRGAELAVTASGAWTDWSGTGEACTADCGFLSASCATDLLPPGTYTFTLAGAPPLMLDIPSQPLAQPCTPHL